MSTVSGGRLDHLPLPGRQVLTGEETTDGLRLLLDERLLLRLGLVSQDVFLFEGSILENTAYGCPEATDAEVKRAAH